MSSNEENFPRYIIYFTWISQNIAWMLCKVFFLVFFKVKVEGLENIKNLKGGIIFASNHVSDFDSVLIRTSIPFFVRSSPLFAVSRSSSDYQWQGWRRFIYKDWFFRFLGAYPAPKGMHDYETALKTFVKLGRSNQSIIIFIGGKQHTIDEPIKNRGGTSYLSWKTGLPVVPVAITGTFGLDKEKIFFKQPQIVISFGKSISKDKLFENSLQDGTEFSNASLIVTKEIKELKDFSDLKN